MRSGAEQGRYVGVSRVQRDFEIELADLRARLVTAESWLNRLSGQVGNIGPHGHSHELGLGD